MDNSSFSFDNTVYFVMGDSLSSVDLKPLIRIGTPFGIGIIIMLIIGIVQIMDILKSVIEKNPFDEKNATRLTVIAIDFFAASVVVNVAKYIMTSYIIHMLGIHNMHANMSLNLSLLLTGFLMLILAGVFKYGNFLKKEYDATL
jgi:hypothetical protein